MDFTSLNDLKKYIEKELKEAMEKEFDNIVKKVWNRHVNQFYREYEPKFYPRSETGGYGDKFPVSLGVVVKGGNIYWECKFDAKDLDHSHWKNGRYEGRRHDTDTAYYLAMDLLEGRHGGATKSGTAPYQETLDELEETQILANELRNALKSKGFIIE